MKWEEHVGSSIPAGSAFIDRLQVFVTLVGVADSESSEGDELGLAGVIVPDLPERLELGAELNPYDRNSFYGGDEKGYTDYPRLAR